MLSVSTLDEGAIGSPIRLVLPKAAVEARSGRTPEDPERISIVCMVAMIRSVARK